MKQNSFQGQLIRGFIYDTFAGRSGRKRINSLVLGAASALLLFAGEPRVSAQYSILHSFGSVPGDGANPTGALIRAPDGNFYGVTNAQAGKTGPNGTVFQMTPATVLRAGELRVIKRFAGQGLPSPLLYYRGTLIGVDTSSLFAVTGYPEGPWGKHFWHQFGSTAGDGIEPLAGLIVGSDGDLYGTTMGGGSAGFGTIYKANPKSHTLTVVYSFTAITPGGTGTSPSTRLLQAKNGNLYGGTLEGIDGGVIFVMTPDGQVAPFLDFCCNQSLTGPLIQGSDGNFYGTAGGLFAATFPDVVFQLTPTGGTLLLHVFSLQYGVTSGVIQGPDGNLYGLINSGGTAGKGFVFELSTDGTSFNVLHNFGDGTVPNDGEYPSGTFVVGSDNNLYGTTYEGGSAGLGTVFRLPLIQTVFRP